MPAILITLSHVNRLRLTDPRLTHPTLDVVGKPALASHETLIEERCKGQPSLLLYVLVLRCVGEDYSARTQNYCATHSFLSAWASITTLAEAILSQTRTE